MYKILGGDGREYGPVSAETLRQWINEGRANALTQIKPEGATAWQALSSLPELAGTFSEIAAAQPSAGARAGGVHDGDYDLDIGGCIGRSFELFKNNVGLLVLVNLIGFLPWIVGFFVKLCRFIPLLGILFSLLGFVISLVTLVIGGPMLGGLYSAYLKVARGQPARASDALAGFGGRFGQLFLGYLIPALFVAACMIPLLVVLVLTVLVPIIKDPQHMPLDPAMIASALIPTGVALLVTLPVILWLSMNWIFTLPLIMDRHLDFWTAMKTSWRQVSRHWWTVFGLSVLTVLINLAGFLACGVGVLFSASIGVGAMMQAYETMFTPRAAQSSPGA